MSQNRPQHSDDSVMKGATPVQEFVDKAHEVTEEERNRPRNGRPVRKPEATQPEPPKAESESPPVT